MSPAEQNLKEQLAKRSSAMMIQMLDASGVPWDVQIEAALLTLGVLFVRNVKPEHAKGLFQRAIKKVRDNMDKTFVAIEEQKKNACH